MYALVQMDLGPEDPAFLSMVLGFDYKASPLGLLFSEEKQRRGGSGYRGGS